jgi:tRNA-Thr(GGU) m(6)t(6)A37 methyltransferase TsaA
MMRSTITAVLCLVLNTGQVLRAEEVSPPAAAEFTVRPIGRIERTNDQARIVLDKRYQPGLLGLEGFSHIHVLWWFDKNDTPQQRSVLQVYPRGDRSNPLTGVFACRAPVRPNLLALSQCKVVSINENVIEISSTDAFDGTPVLDIKPFTPGPDSATDVRVPAWAKPR